MSHTDDLCQVCSTAGCSLSPSSFEIHITVKNADIKRFREICTFIGAKPVLLDLQMNGGIHDVMTSFTIKDVPFSTALSEANRQRDQIEREFEVVRVKIESLPTHPDAPRLTNEKAFGAGQYFESHVAVLTDDVERVREIGRRCGSWHTSRNALKKNEQGSTFMCTLRETIPWERHQINVSKFLGALEQAGIGVKKTRSEFALYDTNQKHDAAWMSGFR